MPVLGEAMSFRFRSKFRTRMLLSGLMALVTMAAKGQEHRVPEAQASQVRVSMPPTERAEGDDFLAREFWQVLSNDLSSTGPFQVLQGPGRPGTPNTQDLLLSTKLVRGHIRPFMVHVQAQDGHTGNPVFKKAYEGSPALIRRMAHRIADDFTEKITGLRGTAESRIVFSQETNPGVKEIFQMDRDGRGLTQLTHFKSLSLSPTLSPDGRLAYITYKGGPPEIWGQRVPGGPQMRLYPIGSNRTDVLLSPSWSPVGNKLAFVESDPTGHCDVMMLDLDRNQISRLTSREGRNTEPAWDPTGRRIAFTSDRRGTPQIYVMESDGASPRPITTGGSANSEPSWKPTGSHIAYVSRSAGQHDVFIYDLSNGKSTRITRGNGNYESPVWSPDGRWIAFTNSISGTSRLMVSDLLGRFVSQLGLLAQVQSPDWSRSR